MEEKEEEIQLCQIIDLDNTKGQAVEHLDHWPPNDTLRPRVLTMDWVLQSWESFLVAYSEKRLMHRKTAWSLL